MASKRKSMSTFVKKPEPPDHVPEVPPATQGYVSGYGAYAPMTAGGVFQGQGLYREKCYSNAYIIVGTKCSGFTLCAKREAHV